MARTPIRSRRISSSRWNIAKPFIERLYITNKLTLKLLATKMEEKHDFIATEAQYRAQFDRWGPGWKKHQKSVDQEPVEIALLRHKFVGRDIDMYRWRKLVPEEQVAQIRDRSRVPHHNLHNEKYVPVLPKGVAIYPRRRDFTEELTFRVPFLDLERSVYDLIVKCRDLATQSTTERVEIRDLFRGYRGLPLQRISDRPLPEYLESRISALNSILPCLHDPKRKTGESFLNTLSGAYISNVHRGLLCALGNNLAGLQGLSSEQLHSILGIVSSLDVLRAFTSIPGYLRHPMIQQLLRISVEVGNVRLVKTILSKGQALQIDVNEQFCTVEGQAYTLLERASMLRQSDMIKIMLEHGANVNKSFPCTHDPRTNLQGGDSCRNCGSRGALQCALLQGPRDHRLDTQIFSLLLARSEKISFSTLTTLMHKREEDFLLEAVEKFAHTCHKDWQMENEYGCIWQKMIVSLTQETTALSLLQIMERFGVTKTTQMLNAAARMGHETVVQEMLADNISLDEYTLCSAIRSENVGLVRRLLRCIATFNDSSPYEDGDLFSAAVLTENDDLIQLMIDNKAMERLGQLRPWLAAWGAALTVSNISLLQRLLAIREDIPEYDLGYALTMVAKFGNYDMALQLLKRGANAAANTGRDTALINALKAKNASLVGLLLHWGANPRDGDPMFPAVAWGDGSVIEKLLAAGATWSSSAFNEAVKKKDLEIMERLLYAGATMEGALEVATQHETTDVCSWLLSHGADPRDSRALYNAYRHKIPSFGTLIQSYKVRYPLGAGGFGSRVLWSALRSNDQSAVELLLEHGADPNGFLSLEGQYGQNFTPFFFTIVEGARSSTSLMELFLNHGHKSRAFKCSPQSIVAELHGSKKGRSGPMITALLAAVSTKSMSVVQLLSQREDAIIDLPASGRITRTPLQRAAEVGDLDLTKFFYGSGADINAPPAIMGGATAVQLAAKGGYTAIVLYLLSKGADVDAPRARIDGMTALEGAAAQGRIDVLSILLRAGAGSHGKDLVQFQRAIAFAEQERHFTNVQILKAYLQSIGQDSLLLEHSIPQVRVTETFVHQRDFTDFQNLVCLEAEEMHTEYHDPRRF
ncbi:hypothetical protein HBI49_115120 [Parastagonospora nodorum]|nr:hypothetical protein HBI76_111110 [Parastagonospora nodorum]KAH5019606.1 hypothetical protein HBI74_159270 [Parastagonospora nodorum]KAH5303026.1 hypothetical protein HBI11_131710 [Parastagonospora nodorum]KAH5363898.1 hypothetical protein HBI49_115120 [Parastagonospora nodorum]KAH5420470.1 hypothetical protein HBI46_090230 [Parastagonospora nodorum]